MKYRHFIASTLFISLIFNSCSEKKVETLQTSRPLLVAGRIYSYGQSDADILTHSEHIGVFVFESASGQQKYSNLGYQATYGTRDDYFQPDDIDNIPHFSLDGNDRWDVSAYFPYDESSDGHVKVSVADQSRITDKTLLLYARAKGLDRDNNTAYLRLSPALSRIVFRFHAGNGITSEQVKGITAKLTGIPSVGNFNMSTAHFTVAEESEATVDMVKAEEIAENMVSAYIIPQADTKGYLAEIQVPGEAEARKYDISRTVVNFDRGIEYAFDITVNKDNLEVRTESGPIAGWGEDGNLDVQGEE